MKKYLVVALAALGVAVFAPQPADAGVSFGFFFGPPIIRRITTTAIPITTGRVTTGIIVTGGTVIVDD
jgi:hypothetical protein